MVIIAVADVNQTYCQGLKTMLEQVEDFRVVVMSPESFHLELANDPSVKILMVDDDLYQSFLDHETEKVMPMPAMKTIVLTMDRGELLSPPHGLEIIYKGSGKREFEDRIRKLAYT
jgi:hypothetical protein